MSDQIECAFTGRVGQEPVIRTTKGGKVWLSTSVAVGAGADAQWCQVAYFGDDAEAMADRITKGVRVYVEGRLRLNAWTDKDGRERSGLSIAGNLIQPIGQIGRRRHAQRVPTGTDQPEADQPEAVSGGRPLDDRIPFLAA
jgi:single-strand DNA-binding protein